MSEHDILNLACTTNEWSKNEDLTYWWVQCLLFLISCQELFWLDSLRPCLLLHRFFSSQVGIQLLHSNWLIFHPLFQAWMTGRAVGDGSGQEASQSTTLTGEKYRLGLKWRGAKSASWCGEGQSGRSGTARPAEVITLCAQWRLDLNHVWSIAVWAIALLQRSCGRTDSSSGHFNCNNRPIGALTELFVSSIMNFLTVLVFEENNLLHWVALLTLHLFSLTNESILTYVKLTFCFFVCFFVFNTCM